MGWIGAIIIGGIAGWLAEKIMSSPMGLLANIGLGIAGGLIGAFIVELLGGSGGGGWIWQLIVATAGACLLIFLVRAIRGRA
jgi:uncharacterized membrane protein YeaQ/YmgE (transglycosylase-associated protein family)